MKNLSKPTKSQIQSPFQSKFFEACINASKEIITKLNTKEQALFTKGAVGNGGDISIGADLMSEEIFKRAFLPLCSIDSEESGFMQGGSSDILVLDPLDGSDNFLSHIPYYGASLALCDEKREVKEAAIINFCTQTMLFGNLESTWEIPLNAPKYAQKILKCDTQSPKCGVFEKAYSNPFFALKLKENGLKFRSLGASALSLSLAHKVKFMLFLGTIREYDCKAGLFLCRDLYISHTQDSLLISKDKQTFAIITRLLNQQQV